MKPKKQTVPPEKKKRITKQYLTEVATWGVNESKWKYAKEYCLDRGWEFRVMASDNGEKFEMLSLKQILHS